MEESELVFLMSVTVGSERCISYVEASLFCFLLESFRLPLWGSVEQALWVSCLEAPVDKISVEIAVSCFEASSPAKHNEL